MIRDLHSKIKATTIFNIVLAADNAPAAFDARGYDALELLLAIGVGGITFDATNKIEFKLTHSDDDSTYIAVTDDDMLGITGIPATGIIKSLVAAHAAATSYRFGYVGGKRYLKLLADFSGTHGTGTQVCAQWLQARTHQGPVAAQA